ncbi:MAG: hypothetical protein IKF91_04220 [Bacilli bacterium]|nr:hypothetical protein [Bacilli bacterium]
MKKELDFYSYGQRMAGEIKESYEETAKKIEEEYGLDARLEFECGLSVALGKQAVSSLDYSIPKMRSHLGYYEGGITTDDELRNNSYLGGTGVSHKYDKDGNYNRR